MPAGASVSNKVLKLIYHSSDFSYEPEEMELCKITVLMSSVLKIYGMTDFQSADYVCSGLRQAQESDIPLVQSNHMILLHLVVHSNQRQWMNHQSLSQTFMKGLVAS